jgi:hypothetical protein
MRAVRPNSTKHLFCEIGIFNFSASQGAAQIGGVFVILSSRGSGRRRTRSSQIFTNNGGGDRSPPTPFFQTQALPRGWVPRKQSKSTLPPRRSAARRITDVRELELPRKRHCNRDISGESPHLRAQYSLASRSCEFNSGRP